MAIPPALGWSSGRSTGDHVTDGNLESARTKAYEEVDEGLSRVDRKPRAPREPSLEKFVKRVARNKLVPAGILDALVSGRRFSSYTGARDFAAHLVEGGHLTRWQASRLLAGQSGFRLGKYKLLDRLGAGGMGVVLKAQHVHMRKIVAVKVLSGTLLKNELALKRFQREAAAAAALDHPNIIRALDADNVDGIPFLVMEYIEGKDLGTLVSERGPLPVELACEFCRQTAAGLEHAWKRELVHRDVKPANLLLTRRSPSHPLVVKILDFGLARFTSTPAAADITSADRIMGTVDFIAPEQARNAKLADARSDVYSLGCTLYYLLTAKPAFDGENPMEKLAARLIDNPTPIGKHRPDLPDGLVKIVERMIAKDPDARFQSYADLMAEMDRFAAAEAVASVREALAAIKSVPRDEEGVGKLPSELALDQLLQKVDREERDANPADDSSSDASARGPVPWPLVASIVGGCVVIGGLVWFLTRGLFGG